MEVKGDLPNNWQFFKDQWMDYEVATGVDKKYAKIRVALLRTVMDKECLSIFKSLDMSDEDRADVFKLWKTILCRNATKSTNAMCFTHMTGT